MTPNQRPTREIVEFPVNIPVLLALKFPTGKRIATLGRQPNGTFTAPLEPAPLETAVSLYSQLVNDVSALVDAYADVLQHALTKHQGRVKPDEVRAIFLTGVINAMGGRHRAH
jgi:hypothetical protein